MNYDEIVNYLKIGHEIEFKLYGIMFSITHFDSWELGKQNTEEWQNFSNLDDMLKNGTLFGKRIEDFCEDMEEIDIF